MSLPEIGQALHPTKPGSSMIDLWLAQHPGKTVDDYLKERASLTAANREPKAPNQYADWKKEHPGGTVEDYISATSGARVGAQEKSARDTAQVALQALPDMQTEMDQLQTKLGPLGGRTMEIGAKIGKTDPTYISLRENADLVISALSKVHFGARGSWQWLQDFKKNLAVGSLSYGDLQAGMKTTTQWLQRYAALGYPKDYVVPASEKPPKLSSTHAAMKEPAGPGGAKLKAVGATSKPDGQYSIGGKTYIAKGGKVYEQ
ncbi:MAG: hypothetical protein KGI66_04215, partial [Patescibacteria group bacterium]|nr:hypothetical protein [Patescibacteria group bacterium]